MCRSERGIFKTAEADELAGNNQLARQRLGLRQSSAALASPSLRGKSGRGPPHSKTSRNFSSGLEKAETVLLKTIRNSHGAHPRKN
jgi:hypothetical protein